MREKENEKYYLYWFSYLIKFNYINKRTLDLKK